MGWGTSWDKPIIGWDIGRPGGDEIVFTKIEDRKITEIKTGEEAKKEIEKHINNLKNKFPTHDPYTNPGAFLYYECECGQVLDPKVKSFAALNNHASNADWRIRWGSLSYIPYCPKCWREKGIE